MTAEPVTATAEPVAGAEPVTTTGESVAAAEPPAARASMRSRVRRGLSTGTLKMVRPIGSVALFVAGIAIGVNIYGAVRPAPPPTGNPELANGEPPAVVREFIASLKSNDADATRAALGAAPYGLLAGELQEWGYREVTDVETLGTLVAGDASSTAIVLRGRSSNGGPLISNLVVQVESGTIVSFR